MFTSFFHSVRCSTGRFCDRVIYGKLGCSTSNPFLQPIGYLIDIGTGLVYTVRALSTHDPKSPYLQRMFTIFHERVPTFYIKLTQGILSILAGYRFANTDEDLDWPIGISYFSDSIIDGYRKQYAWSCIPKNVKQLCGLHFPKTARIQLIRTVPKLASAVLFDTIVAGLSLTGTILTLGRVKRISECANRQKTAFQGFAWLLAFTVWSFRPNAKIEVAIL